MAEESCDVVIIESRSDRKRHSKISYGECRYLYASVATVLLPGFTVGTLIGWEFHYTYKNDADVIAVPFLYIGALIGVLIASIVMDRCGRHVCLWAFFWFIYLEPLIRCVTADVTAICIVRFIAGVSVGAYFQIVPIYLAELCHRRHRGVIMASLGCFIAIGIIASSESFVYITMLVFDLIFGILFFILKFFYAPETPYYDMAQDNFVSARHTLQCCRRSGHWAGEIREITLDVSAYPNDASNCFSFAVSLFELNADFLHRFVTGTGLLILSLCMFVTCDMSFNRFNFNTTEQTIVYAMQFIIVILAFLVNVFVIDVCGRKLLLFVSAIGVTVFYLVLFALYCAQYGNGSIAVTIFRKLVIFYFYLGWDFIPIIYMVELLPYRTRASAVACFLILYFIARSICPLINFYSLLYMDEACQAIMFFFVALACVFFSWFIPPETKQMSLCAIQIKMDHDVTVLERRLEID